MKQKIVMLKDGLKLSQVLMSILQEARQLIWSGDDIRHFRFLIQLSRLSTVDKMEYSRDIWNE